MGKSSDTQGMLLSDLGSLYMSPVTGLARLCFALLVSVVGFFNWRPFYEAQFGVEIFVELYTLRFHHQSPPKCC